MVGILALWPLAACQVNHAFLQPGLHFFQPKVRTYFDTGTDDPDEPDLFNDGGLSAAVEFVEWRKPLHVPHFIAGDNLAWNWGPTLGLGLSSAAGGSDDEGNASSAPVFLASVGLRLEVPNVEELPTDIPNRVKAVENASKFAFELGWTTGWSTDEDFDDADDSAVYVGFVFDF